MPCGVDTVLQSVVSDPQAQQVCSCLLFNQPLIQRVKRALSTGVNRRGCPAYHLVHLVRRPRMNGVYLHSPQHLHGVHSDKLTFILNQEVLSFSETNGQPHIQQVGGIATRYGLDGLGNKSCPDQPRGPRSLLYNGYRPIPRGKVAWAWN